MFGDETNHGEFPWQVSLRKRSKLSNFCGGALINSWTAITAAHCLHKGGVRGYLHKQFMVALGWQKSRGGSKSIRKQNRKFGQELKLIILTKGSEQGKVFIHPEYQGENYSEKRNVYMPNDIAIIEFHREVKFPKYSDAGQCWHFMLSFSKLYKIYSEFMDAKSKMVIWPKDR